MKTKEIELLLKLVGDWTVDLRATMPDGSSLEREGTVRATRLSLDRGVRTELKGDVPGMGEYHEHDLWGYDQWGKRIHMFSVTSTGAAHDHSGTWKDDKTLHVRWEGLCEGKPATEDVVMTWAGDNEILVREVDTSEGQPGPVFDYVLRKQ